MTDSQALTTAGRTSHSDATDDLDAVITSLRLVLDRPGDPLPVDRATLERLTRHAGRALLYLTENGPR